MTLMRKILTCIVIGYLLFVIFGLIVRVFLFDSFIVRGNSMNPTFSDGEKVYVNKLIFGARLYIDFDINSSELHSVRTYGFRNIKVGDIVVFNYPYGRIRDTISFKINYVYLKRCFAIPGDMLWVKNGMYINSNTSGHIGDIYYQEQLKLYPDSLIYKEDSKTDITILNWDNGWNIKNWGPIYIPGKGDRVTLSVDNFNLYAKLILYETGLMPQMVEDKIFIGGSVIDYYEFQSNWYFFGGDNVLNSKDSRNFGLVPEEYIIGVV